MTPSRLLRGALGAAGVAAMALGAVLLLTDRQVGSPAGVLSWLAAAVLLHDGVLVPFVLAAGALLPPRARRPLRAALITAGCLTAVALPVMLRQGQGVNPSVLPLDYVRNWGLAMGGVAVVTAGRLLLGRLRRRRERAGRRSRNVTT
ncbi:hypothetical protein ACIP9H_01865 [Streptomyces sp. NPDC088732]|uniref:hypothetical protein n=1 Tax=Streptomyces sp. NPDC088732 TaxID=3365879 RepID=UPI0037FDCD10